MKPGLSLIVFIVLLSILSCKKTESWNPSKDEGSFWAINGERFNADSLVQWQSPYWAYIMEDQQPGDTGRLMLYFLKMPSTAGTYSLMNADDYFSKGLMPDLIHIRVDEGGKIYRNYTTGLPQIQVVDSAGLLYAKIIGLVLQNDVDHSLTTTLDAVICLVSQSQPQWSVGQKQRTTTFQHFPSSGPSWTFKSNSGSSINLTLSHKPAHDTDLSSNQVGMSFYMNRPGKVPVLLTCETSKTTGFARIQHKADAVWLTLEQSRMPLSVYETGSATLLADTMSFYIHLKLDKW